MPNGVSAPCPAVTAGRKPVGMELMGSARLAFVRRLAQCLALACFVVLSFTAAPAQEMPEIELAGGNFQAVPGTGEARFMAESTANLTPEQALARLDDFAPLSTPNIDFGMFHFERPRYWLHVRVHNATGDAGEWVLDVGRNGTDLDVAAYKATGAGRIDKLFACSYGQCSGVVPGFYIAGSFSLEPDETADILLSLSGLAQYAPISFTTPERHFQTLPQRSILIWAANGLWIGLILMALLLGRVIGWPLALSFAAYQLNAFLNLAFSWGAFRGVVPAKMETAVAYGFLQLLPLTLLLFCRQLFRTKENFPRVDRIILVVAALALLNMPILVLAFPPASVAAAMLLSLVAILIQVVTALRAMRNDMPGGIPVLLGALLVLAAGVVDGITKTMPGVLAIEMARAILHACFLLEAMLFAIAISLRVFMLRVERDAALGAQVAAAREQLRLGEALAASRRRFDRAQREAQLRKRELAALGHDLMQPLAALRAGFGRLEAEADDEAERVRAAFTFLEGLARREARGHETGSQPGVEETAETFPVMVVVGNVERMFSRDARERGIRLRSVASSADVHADPVALTRILSNLVSNAITHGNPPGILIGCRRRGDHLRIEVHDDGDGMTPDALDRMLEAGEKRAGSPGSGLGLNIVRTLCAEQELGFSARSIPGGGTSFYITVPMA